MRFSTIIVPFAALATSVFAAECFSQGGSKTCMSLDGMKTAINDYCSNNRQGHSVYTDAGNDFEGSISGGSPSESFCFDALNAIVNQCAGHKNGGSFSGECLPRLVICIVSETK